MVEFDLDPETRERLLEFRRALQVADFQAARDRDRAVLSLSAGALVLSITFLTGIDDPQWLWVLWVSWGSLIGALVAMVFTYPTSQEALRSAITNIDEQLQSNRATGKNYDSPTTRKLNTSATVAMVAGLVFMSVFAALNM